MNANMKEYVMNLLDGYHRRAREIALLRYELAHPVRVTDQEMIGAMNFARSAVPKRNASAQGIGRRCRRISSTK